MSSVLSASAKGASFLILIQITSRASTFIINNILLRYLSPKLLGASSQLELYSISLLYFSRESIRVALQRQTGDAQAVVNVSWIPTFLGVPLAFLLSSFYKQNNDQDIPYVAQSLQIYNVASILELISEPCFAVVQRTLSYGIRAFAETTATVARCAVTLAFVIWSRQQGHNYGVLPFALGQLTYGSVLILCYFGRTIGVARTNGFSLFLKKIVSETQSEYIMSFFSRSICFLSLNLYLQLSVKYVLTHADSLVVALMASLHDQGIYSLASNYGGLIARVIFQPIEESGRNILSKLCTSDPGDEEPKPRDLDHGISILVSILKLYNMLALVAWTIGPYLAPMLLHVVAGSKWSNTEAGSVLATYCYYIPLLAVNGITEGFSTAVAGNAELRKQSVTLCGYSIAFAGAAYILLRVLGLGAEGLVLANCVNMLLRIISNGFFTLGFFRRYGKEFPVREVLPSGWSVAFAVGTYGVVRATANNTVIQVLPTVFLNQLAQLLILGTVLAGAILISEREFLMLCYKRLQANAGVDEVKDDQTRPRRGDAIVEQEAASNEKRHAKKKRK